MGFALLLPVLDAQLGLNANPFQQNKSLADSSFNINNSNILQMKYIIVDIF